MADAAISATVKVILETVISIAADCVGMVLGVKAELERLSKTTTTIQGFLDDADGKMHSPGVRDWLKQLEDEVFKTDNVLDELRYDNLRREVKYRNQLTKKKVCFFFSFFNAIGFSSSLASKIRDINSNLKRINQQANDLGLTDSIIVPNVVGRSGDESKIVKMLLTPSERVVSVIPIAGMGGLGKTTLAKSVYNSTKIDENFGIKSWVCVAREIKIVEMFKLILESLTRTKVEVDGREAIVQETRGKLGEKIFLLVLDDVWNCEQGLWSDFFTTLLGLSTTKGSWCILTTRLQPVANAVLRHLQMNDGPYFLGKLSGDECWSIIKRKVLAGEEVPKELEAIQEQILRRCDGLPLAASLIGGLLLNNRREKWHSIIDQILKVSFDHLSPPSVKKCFAYCSIFAQDTELGEDELIEHWVAEGFVLPNQENTRMMEEREDEYLRILLQSSLLEKVADKRSTYYKMHDLVNDFAKSVLNPKCSSQDRYLALHSYEEMEENVRRNKAASIRSLFLQIWGGISPDMLSRFKHLHVLKLFGYFVMFLPSLIGKLLHLRLLNISSSGITSMPESLCKLCNLQTLTMRDRALEGGFPKRMSDLISLRHLNYYHYHAEFKMPAQMGQLTCLQTLKFFNVSQESGCGIEELGTLKYLKGSLEIRNLELVKDMENLVEWKEADQVRSTTGEAEVDAFPMMRDFRIESCPQLTTFPCSGKSLDVRYCCNLTSIKTSYGTASVEELSISFCNNLRELSEDVFGSSLQRLIQYCDDLTTIPYKMFESCPSLQYLYVEDCPNLVSFSLNLQETPSLKQFVFIGSPKLIPHWFKGFAFATNLRKLISLSINSPFSSDDSSIDDFDWSGLRAVLALRELRLEGLPHTESLALQLQYFTTLTSLRRADFGGLEVLPDWIGNLMSLKILELRNCEKLRSLPSEAAMRRLTKLTRIEVYRCPLLRQRYTPHKGIYLEEFQVIL
ncbi:unnamed protein product [Coffea canephora]|uniref:DH200=94 genomic scaffold, scaffold_1239 n=1 Tax=Coffea canephora TaxID=49390 RepID=A0A068VLB5_COFCA|nr:unnamed protein product [Coffea canephora]